MAQPAATDAAAAATVPAADAQPMSPAAAAAASAAAEEKRIAGEAKAAAAKAAKEAKAAAKAAAKPAAAAAAKGDAKGKDRSILGVTTHREVNFSEWYTQVLTRAEMIEYYDISGCYILRPAAYALWESIQEFINGKIKASGVQNTYFPLLVSKHALEREKSHIEGFSEEVAWVTKAGQSVMAEPVAIRPTSETVMYPAFAQWVRSHRDLPLRLNQWCNVLRWEFKHAVPFLRSREFLWQEGHTAFAKKEEADKEVLEILGYYEQTYQELLAVPVIRGRKSEGEKFAGGLYTTTVEGYIAGAGRAIQGATSHCLGQNFSKMFNIQFEDDTKQKQFAWQNSWGFTTRSIGVMVMVHGDNQGLVLPPRVAQWQVVIIPLLFKDKDSSVVLDKAHEVKRLLTAAGVRVHVDDREGYNPGVKYCHWELRGIPLRIEVGPRDIEAARVSTVTRDNATKEEVAESALVTRVPAILAEIQARMFAKAKKELDEKLAIIEHWEEFVPLLEQGRICLAPWCEEVACEEDVKKRSKAESEARKEASASDSSFQLSGAAKSLCIPFEQPARALPQCCFQCKKPAKSYTLFGRSY